MWPNERNVCDCSEYITSLSSEQWALNTVYIICLCAREQSLANISWRHPQHNNSINNYCLRTNATYTHARTLSSNSTCWEDIFSLFYFIIDLQLIRGRIRHLVCDINSYLLPKLNYFQLQNNSQLSLLYSFLRFVCVTLCVSFCCCFSVIALSFGCRCCRHFHLSPLLPIFHHLFFSEFTTRTPTMYISRSFDYWRQTFIKISTNGAYKIT